MNKLAASIPKTTTPLTKFIRTTEGILIVFFNAAMLVVPIVSNFPAVQAAKWAGIVNAAAVISRSGLKSVALFSKDTGLTPIDVSGVPEVLTGLPPDDASDTAVMSTMPQSGVTPDPGVPEVKDDTPPAPVATPPATARRRVRDEPQA